MQGIVHLLECASLMHCARAFFWQVVEVNKTAALFESRQLQRYVQQRLRRGEHARHQRCARPIVAEVLAQCKHTLESLICIAHPSIHCIHSRRRHEALRSCSSSLRHNLLVIECAESQHIVARCDYAAAKHAK